MSKLQKLAACMMAVPGVICLYFTIWAMAYPMNGDEYPVFYFPVFIATVLVILFMGGLWLYIDEQNKKEGL